MAMKINLSIELNEEQIKSLLMYDNTLDLTFNMGNNKLWPDTQNYEPAKMLTRYLNGRNIYPSELPEVSYERVAYILKTNGMSSRENLVIALENIEGIFRIKFAGPFKRYDTPLAKVLSTRTANAIYHAGVCTDMDLNTIRLIELEDTRTVGKKAIEEVQSYLAEKGRRLI